jgi:drug/metabolite transporter (DMT)-like permease
LFSFFALPVIVFLKPGIFTSVSLVDAIVLIINGSFLSVAVGLYLYALDIDEASYVAPFFQFYPIFGFILSYFFLGEVLTKSQLFGAIFVILGSVILSIEFTKVKSKFKKKLILLMIGSSFFYAVNAVIFKSIAVNQGFMDSLFWDMLGKFLLGILILMAFRKYRLQFMSLIEGSGGKVMVLNLLSEAAGLIGELALIFALLYAPVVLVQSVSGLQPLFVLILGIIITLHFPKFGKEEMSHRHLAQKITGILIVTVGIAFLTFS